MDLTCLIKWCEHGGRTCPICKIPIREIRLDTEFNELNSPGEVNTPYINSDNEIIVDFNKNDLAGLTLENNFTVGGFKNRGPGVKISKINKKDKCYISGLRINDILLFINNVPCSDHKQSIDIIQNCVKTGSSMRCILLKPNSLK